MYFGMLAAMSNVTKELSLKMMLLTNELSDLHGACPTPISSSIAENLALLSAASMSSGDVPSMFTSLLCRGKARLLGICPPTEIIAPFDFYKTKQQ